MEAFWYHEFGEETSGPGTPVCERVLGRLPPRDAASAVLGDGMDQTSSGGSPAERGYGRFQ
eukprot:7900441-Pyramimonas_sp.AAC.1